MKPGDLLVDSGSSHAGDAVPVRLAAGDTVETVLDALPDAQRAWAQAQGFKGQRERMVLLPGEAGAPQGVLFGLGERATDADPFLPGRLASLLPDGLYSLADIPSPPRLAALAWLMEAYRFDRYKSKPAKAGARLVVPEGVDRDDVLAEATAVSLARDLINTPANDLGPDELEAATRDLARTYKAHVKTVHEEEHLKRNFPMIHAVGRASPRAPRLIDLMWGPASGPHITLVGKGVCFDTGGLNIKPGNAMSLMKKDMGGAANVLALARMIMAADLPVRLRVLIPAVENAISGDAFRPGDVLASRKGLSVEIGNTDAEGRLVLADALALADEDAPDLMIDMATLTGAARVALGPDLPPFYTDDDELAAALSRHAAAENDPLWRMPLWGPYDRWLDSKVADVNHISDSSFAGSVVAALFLKRFVEKAKAYIHLDIYGWTPKAHPGHPVGGEAQGIRALFAMIRDRYAGGR
ncbi:leucyl aminopeptidase family protein [Kaustia mangrovi]|uniref:Leucyl aminopeptidase family protein n=1 Tax=Kaustia mangrovi TaxID=2593653 RepID=A0A7S8HCR1_9HYPH|nr:leucyl aminopeptidase family protein [Kaustia mangrovi]QPC43860.1 leucyl aminopeptidase family protein [Kaustia mangrovi]